MKPDIQKAASDKERNLKAAISVLSFVIPLVVALLFRIKLDVAPLSFLPPIYASINGLTSLVLITAFLAVTRGHIKLHQRLMTIALGLSALFLICYVAYHITSDPTYFGDSNHDGSISLSERSAIKITQYIYYPLLISHILLSVMVIPLVLFTFLRGLRTKVRGSGEDTHRSHKKLARITFPIWLYVTISGVVIYVMITPYY